MVGADEAALRAAISRENLARHLEALCRWERVSGQEGERRAAEYIEKALAALGIAPEVHEFDAYVSYPISARLEAVGPRALAVEAITHSFSAPTEGPLTAPLVDGGGGTPEELRRVAPAGKAVLTDGLALPWKVKAVEAAGAVAHINACRGPRPHAMCVSPVWGTPTPEDLARLPRIPVLSTGREGGRGLRALLGGGREVLVTLEAKVWTGWARLRLPVAEVRGPRASEEFILVGSHYDSWYAGATDTATSDALLLEMARLLGERRGELRRGVRLAWWPGHSQGRYAGSAWYADRFWADLYHRGVAYLNLDGPGCRYVDRFRLAASAELADFNRRTVVALSGMPVEEAPAEGQGGIPGRPGRQADQSFLALGLPSLAAYGTMPPDHPQRGPDALASGGGWYWHTPDDTPDKVDLDLLALETFLFTAQVLRLATAPVLPFALKHTAEDFLQLLHVFREAAGDLVDFEEARREARRFREDCGNLEVHRRAVEALGDTWKAAALNGTLRALTRILNPVLYTRRGPFRPDPAEPQGLLPGLRPALGAAALPAGERRFLAVELTRELNRVAHALAAASDLVEGHLREEMEEYD